MRSTLLLCAFVVTVAAPALASTAVRGVLASSGRYAVYVGSADASELHLLSTNECRGDGDAPSAARRSGDVRFDLEDHQLIYVAVWCASDCDSGLLAEFGFNGLGVMSGDPAWEAVPTGMSQECCSTPPAPARLAQDIRMATRGGLWAPAAKRVLNGVGAIGRVDTIARRAAWMWAPKTPLWGDACNLTGSRVMLFRLAPKEIWPEIEHQSSTNVGAPAAGGYTYGGPGSSPGLTGGGGSGFSGSSELPSRGPTFNASPRTPVSDDPLGSFFTPPTGPAERQQSSPLVPPPVADPDPVAAEIQPTDPFTGTNTSSDIVVRTPPGGIPPGGSPPGGLPPGGSPPGDVPPPNAIPEPATVIVMLILGAMSGALRRGR